MEKTIDWKDGNGVITVTYNGDGTGVISITSTPNNKKSFISYREDRKTVKFSIVV